MCRPSARSLPYGATALTSTASASGAACIAVTALFVRNELAGGSDRQQRNAAYLQHALASGRHPRLAELLAPAAPAQGIPPEEVPGPADPYRDILARILSGLLAPGKPSA